MYSIGILSVVLFAIVATTSALECRPVTCMIACPFGFELNAQGCPHCSCRRTAQACVDPIFGYNCGTIDHRDCPSSHHCQLGFSGLSGQCCLTPASSTTSKTSTATSTTRSTTASTGTSTHRALNHLLMLGTGATAGFESSTRRTATSVATTRRSWIFGRSVEPFSTTQVYPTFGGSTDSVSTTNGGSTNFF